MLMGQKKQTLLKMNILPRAIYNSIFTKNIHSTFKESRQIILHFCCSCMEQYNPQMMVQNDYERKKLKRGLSICFACRRPWFDPQNHVVPPNTASSNHQSLNQKQPLSPTRSAPLTPKTAKIKIQSSCFLTSTYFSKQKKSKHLGYWNRNSYTTSVTKQRPEVNLHVSGDLINDKGDKTNKLGKRKVSLTIDVGKSRQLHIKKQTENKERNKLDYNLTPLTKINSK